MASLCAYPDHTSPRRGGENLVPREFIIFNTTADTAFTELAVLLVYKVLQQQNMSSSSRSSSSSPLPLKVRRKRASTKDFLGSEYQEMVTKVLDPPKPGKNAQEYDGKRLREGLKYADSTLRSTERKLSPLGMRAVLLYKEAVANLLDLEENVDPEQDEEEVEAAKEAFL